MPEPGRVIGNSALHGRTGMLASVGRVHRGLAGLLILAYVAAMGGFLALHALGDSGADPAAYFFTWDMFPGFFTESTRRVAVGKTAGGKFLQLHPSAFQQYRGGNRPDITRVDLDREGGHFREVAERVLELTAGRQAPDPVVHVYLLERYWPHKFNYPDDLYRAWFGADKPQRHNWRLRGEFDVPVPSPASVSLPP